jgi:hypothetical protein
MAQRPGQHQVPQPYRSIGPKARYLKAVLQMGIGLGAVAWLGYWLWRKVVWDDPPATAGLTDELFRGIGFALACAAVIELAYTLFTDGPDEALNPVMLGVAAALLIQLGLVGEFDLRQAAAAFLYVLALGGLFATRRWLADDDPRGSWTPGVGLACFAAQAKAAQAPAGSAPRARSRA